VQRTDLALRLVAGVIAVSLFLIVSGDRRVTASYTVPVVAAQPAGARAAATPPPAAVTVVLSGPWARLRGVSAETLGPIRLDLTREASGLRTWYVRSEETLERRLPRGVRLEDIRLEDLHPAQGELGRGELR
jgi:hypothetical protein